MFVIFHCLSNAGFYCRNIGIKTHVARLPGLFFSFLFLLDRTWAYEDIKTERTSPTKNNITLPASSIDWRFSNDGTLFCCRSDNLLYFWNTDTGKLIGRLEPSPHIQAFCLSPDNSVVVVEDNEAEQLSLWNIRTGHRKTIFPYKIGYLFGMTFSPDGHVLAVTTSFNKDKDSIALTPIHLSLKSRKLQHTKFRASTSTNTTDVTTVRVANSGVVLFDTRTGRCIGTLQSHGKDKAWAVRVAFSPDGHWIAALGGIECKTRSGASCIEFCDEYILAIWNAKSGKQVWESHQLHDRYFLEFASKANLLLCGDQYVDMAVAPWGLHSLAKMPRPKRADGTTESMYVKGFFDLRGNQVLLDCYDSGLQVWDIRTGKVLRPAKEGIITAQEHPQTEMLAYNPHRQLTAETDDLTNRSHVCLEQRR